ncbi:MbcA/ParS/Xre antitoxin family protein [Labrys monachus]|uniref:DNA-binding XRE family transcriptional regulator n=1 Tax=Labrys monachus TaxID=217067 RepID=A0ABU0FAY4_9HYPH|nr:MbcA/ParS/Xre antitoxin family protein [Labrys monachus]MDQ0391774.1 DNA-binding XRE family transcriptional regulator [Labrys monachus]
MSGSPARTSRKATPPDAGRDGLPLPAEGIRPGTRFVTSFFDDNGLVQVDRVIDRFGMSKSQLAETIGLRPETLQRVSRAVAARTQSRVTEMLEIVARIAAWAGSERQAMAWYRAEPLPAFGGRTAESLVKEGRAGAVRDYLDHIALGGFA